MVQTLVHAQRLSQLARQTLREDAAELGLRLEETRDRVARLRDEAEEREAERAAAESRRESLLAEARTAEAEAERLRAEARSAHARAFAEFDDRTSQAALLREHDCRWFQACLVSQALSHPRRDDLDLDPAEPRAQLSFRDWPNSCPRFVRVKRRFYSQLVTRVPPRCSGPTTKAHLACLVRGRGRLVQIASP